MQFRGLAFPGITSLGGHGRWSRRGGGRPGSGTQGRGSVVARGAGVGLTILPAASRSSPALVPRHSRARDDRLTPPSRQAART